MSLVELKISQQVTGGTEVSQSTIVIPDKKLITIYAFTGSCPDSPLATARIEFGSDILAIVQRDRESNRKIVVEGNGVDQIQIVASNLCNDSYYFDVYAKIGLED